jgi:23S rRNA (cytidine2498-2'-O)-methyltransferase
MAITQEYISGAAFLAFPEMAPLLQSELAGRFGYGALIAAATAAGVAFQRGSARFYGDLLYCPDWTGGIPYWARTVMRKPFILHFDSIGEAAKTLSGIQRNWAPYQYQCFRRAALVQEKLPYVKLKPRTFPADIPVSPMGLYTFIDEKTIIASAETSSALPAGTLLFEEDHENPPSRAYLKLQESLTLAHHLTGVPLPGLGQRCFDAGACPGGWTWVLRQLGADVFAIDRAELAPGLMADPHVTFQAHDAFTLTPSETGPFDWVFSDVICYPERLYEWVQGWLSSGLVTNMICTIKIQGAVDWPLVARFAAIPDSRVVHLNYNKHELTWIHAQAKENGVS